MHSENPFNPKDKIDHLLRQVEDLHREISELESQIAEKRAALQSPVTALAQAVDSQAERARVLRTLYWEANLPVPVIDEAFKIGAQRIRQLAGTYTVHFPCDRCAQTIAQVVTSKTGFYEATKRKHYQREKLCETCEAEDARQKEQSVAEFNQQRRKRFEELTAMPWRQFIATPEWKNQRNWLLVNCYHCHACKFSGDLNLCFDREDLGNVNQQEIHIFCDDCLSRNSEVVNPNRQERVSRELIEWVWDQHSRCLLKPMYWRI